MQKKYFSYKKKKINKIIRTQTGNTFISFADRNHILKIQFKDTKHSNFLPLNKTNTVFLDAIVFPIFAFSVCLRNLIERLQNQCPHYLISSEAISETFIKILLSNGISIHETLFSNFIRLP